MYNEDIIEKLARIWPGTDKKQLADRMLSLPDEAEDEVLAVINGDKRYDFNGKKWALPSARDLVLYLTLHDVHDRIDLAALSGRTGHPILRCLENLVARLWEFVPEVTDVTTLGRVWFERRFRDALWYEDVLRGTVNYEDLGRNVLDRDSNYLLIDDYGLLIIADD